MKNLKNLGKALSKNEQKQVNGGAPQCPSWVCKALETFPLQPSCECY